MNEIISAANRILVLLHNVILINKMVIIIQDKNTLVKLRI
jgi:hypothetical protein